MGFIMNPVGATALGTGYSRSYSISARTHTETALTTELSVAALLTDVIAQLNTTNKAVNELKKLTNSLITDLQEGGVLK